MILIITHKEDYTADYLIHKLNKKKISYYRFNCEDITDIPYRVSSSGKFNLSLAENNSFHSVWYRRTKLPNIQASTISEKNYLLSEYDALLNNFYSSIKATRWLSKPESISKSENKVYQLKTAQAIGFNIPDTLMTNDKKELPLFAAKHKNNIVIKPISSGRIIHEDGIKLIFTNKLKESHIKNIHDFDITPCIFQEYIDKEYELRVTVVNDRVFSAKVHSQSDEETQIDWRRKKLRFEPCKLPVELAQKCLKLLKKLHLSFGAIDLIRTKNGSYYFLEINPNGQWAWIEIDTKLKISNEIITFLTS